MKTVRMSEFPKNLKGIIVNYDNEDDAMPLKIIDMGLVPRTEFFILYQAPFNGHYT